MSSPLLATKLYRPPARGQAVARPRLTEKLLAGACRPGCFCILSGPAGFGKTTLLGEFLAGLAIRTAWLSLDAGDNDPFRFWTYLVVACQTAEEGLGPPLLPLLQSPQPLPVEAAPAGLINVLAAWGGELVLVLDDYHTIRNEAINAGMTYLLEHLPPNLHLIVATRVDPPWPLSRFRARNQLVEVRSNELRFNREEAAAFLNRIMGLKLSAEEITVLEERTEGWAAGLQLAGLSLQGRDDRAAFIRSFSGRNAYVAEYLVEEVLQNQPQEVQDFLLKSSILEDLTGDLCVTVTGCAQGQAMLQTLQRANLFVVSTDDQDRWFRYHHLFANLLQARLRLGRPPGEIAALHARAAAWYDQAGMPAAAVEHSLAAKDYPHALALIERHALPMILQAYVRTVEEWLKAIPPALLEASPAANMAFVWLHLLRGTPEQAAPYLERLEAHFSTPGQEDPLQGEWLAIRSRLMQIRGDAAACRDLAQRALERLPEIDSPARSIVLATLASAYAQMLDYQHAAETFQCIVREAQVSGDQGAAVLGISGRAQMLLQQGKLHQACEAASQGIQLMETLGKPTPFSATLYGEMGQIHYYWRRLDPARKYLQLSIQASGQAGYSDPGIFRHLMACRIFHMEGDWQAADEEMQQAAALAARTPPAMIRWEMLSQQVRVHLALHRPAAAEALLEPEGFAYGEAFVHPLLAPDAVVLHTTGLLYNSALRILLYRSRTGESPAFLEEGIELAGRVLAGELLCGHLPIAVETLLLRAQLRAEIGDEAGSLDDVSLALEMTQAEGFISPFVEEGAFASLALSRLAQRCTPGSPRARYIADLLAAFSWARSGPANPPAQEGERLIEPLTARELEVLRLIGEGDSNQEIAQKLVITVSAVKKHSSNIFGKLCAANRTQAVVRARQLKILA